jgi:hypothetical protein
MRRRPDSALRFFIPPLHGEGGEDTACGALRVSPLAARHHRHGSATSAASRPPSPSRGRISQSPNTRFPSRAFAPRFEFPFPPHGRRRDARLAPKAPKRKMMTGANHTPRPTIVIAGSKCALLTRSCRTRFVVRMLRHPALRFAKLSPPQACHADRGPARFKTFGALETLPLRGTRGIMRGIFRCLISFIYPPVCVIPDARLAAPTFGLPVRCAIGSGLPSALQPRRSQVVRRSNANQ